MLSRAKMYIQNYIKWLLDKATGCFFLYVPNLAFFVDSDTEEGI